MTILLTNSVIVLVSMFVAVICGKAAIDAAVTTTAASINSMLACDVFAGVVMVIGAAGIVFGTIAATVQTVEDKFGREMANDISNTILLNIATLGFVGFCFGMMMITIRNGGLENAIPAAVVAFTSLVITFAAACGMDYYYAHRWERGSHVADAFSFAALLFPAAVVASIVYAIAATYVGLWSKMGILGIVWYTEFFGLAYGAIDAVQTNFWTEE